MKFDLNCFRILLLRGNTGWTVRHKVNKGLTIENKTVWKGKKILRDFQLSVLIPVIKHLAIVSVTFNFELWTLFWNAKSSYDRWQRSNGLLKILLYIIYFNIFSLCNATVSTCRAAGLSIITSAAWRSALEALCSPSAAITWSNRLINDLMI